MVPNSFVDALADAIVRELRSAKSTVRSSAAPPTRRSRSPAPRFDHAAPLTLGGLDDRSIEAVASALIARLAAAEHGDELPLDRIEI